MKKALAILDEVALFPSTTLSLIQFAAAYYHHPIGDVVASAMPALLKQGKPLRYQPPDTVVDALPEVAPVLSSAQQEAVTQILEKAGQFQPFLLWGVTGSGKTEVYLQIIEQIVKQKKQALLLVPEIGLTPQMVSRFEKRFSMPLAILHSGLTDKERQNAWLQARDHTVSIIIGTRSAIFTPLKNPGIIIIDEEHDASFKQQEGFKYSARDLAIVRAKLENIPVILGSATPALESMHNVDIGRYEQLSLPERAGSAVHPQFKVVDLRKSPTQQGLSQAVIESIQKHLLDGSQVLIFLNRRGFAPVLICHVCGWIAQCDRCDARMTLHQKPFQLQCHHCGAVRKVDQHCKDCGEANLHPVGVGTERIEETLIALFKKVSIIRIDRDTTRKKGALKEQFNKIHGGEPCILVGTQMLAKGHHFPAVTLSVILNVDSGLLSSDFRGMEKTAQLILQVAGRAGRVEKPGEVILQTYHPQHELLQVLLEKGYGEFAKLALIERKQAEFPPYAFLALIKAESVNISSALSFLTEIKNLLAKKHLNLLGPLPAPMQKKAGKHRAHLLLQSPTRKPLQETLNFLITHLATLKSKQRVRWSIDVDPLEMF